MAERGCRCAAGSDRRRAGARWAPRRARRTDGRQRGPDGGASALPKLRPAPLGQPRAPSPGSPRAPDGPRGQGDPARAAPAALGCAAAPGRAAPRRLLGGGPRYGRAPAPGASPLPAHPPALGPRCPAQYWLRVLSLACASSSLAGRGTWRPVWEAGAGTPRRPGTAARWRLTLPSPALGSGGSSRLSVPRDSGTGGKKERKRRLSACGLG